MVRDHLYSASVLCQTLMCIIPSTSHRTTLNSFRGAALPVSQMRKLRFRGEEVIWHLYPDKPVNPISSIMCL